MPTAGPQAARSGEFCWGTNLAGNYSNDSDSWLLSPPIDLRGLASASLSFWVFNDLEDRNQGLVYDPLWLDLTVDGEHFVPLCSHMGGVNDDPEIPQIGGWSHLVLDLTRYVGHEHLQIRFRFQSNGNVARAGAYIDDVKISGRPAGEQLMRRARGRIK